MGSLFSKPARMKPCFDPPLPENRANAWHKDNDVIQFDPKQSHAICIGMDHLEGMPEQSLGPLVASDCKALTKACSEYMHIPPANVKQVVASEDPKRCFTRDGLSTLLVDCARSVGEEGILVITFSGHGTTVVRDGTEQAVLPLLGHTAGSPECLDGKDIMELIQTEAKFCGKNILLVLDCCFSGGIAEWLQCNERADGVFRTIAVCSPYQTSIQFDPLENSTFTYFLIDALSGRQGITELCQMQQEGLDGPMVRLCLQDTIAHICASSWALSAMYVKYNIASQSHQGCMIEEVDGVESTDGIGSKKIERLSFLHKYWGIFDKIAADQPSVRNSYKWLREQAKPNGPLVMLKDRGHLVGKVLQATICALSNSVATIHLYEKHPWNGRAGLFIIDFTEIISLLELVISGDEQVTMRPKAVSQALTYYFAVYSSAECHDLDELRKLYGMLLADESQLAHEGANADALTDEPQEDIDAAAAMLTNWQPLVALDSSDQGICPHSRALQRKLAHQL